MKYLDMQDLRNLYSDVPLFRKLHEILKQGIQYREQAKETPRRMVKESPRTI